MNDISTILNKIINNAKEYEKGKRDAAKIASDEVLEEYHRQAQEVSVAILEEAKAQAEAIRQRAISQGGVEERNQLLAARRQAIDKVFTRSLERLRALPAKERKIFYAGQAVKYISIDADATLILCQKDQEELGRELVQEIENLCKKVGKNCTVTLANEPGNFLGGFVLREGNIETNCTFEVLNRNAQEELEAQVAQILFG